MILNGKSNDSILNGLSTATGTKRKATATKEKPNKQTRIDKFYLKECQDKKGFEQEFARKAEGRADISIDQIHVKEDFGLPIDKVLVNKLAADFLIRPDPTFFMLSVVPDNLVDFDIDRAEEEENSYTVIHGRQR